jgi:hypothetical protein
MFIMKSYDTEISIKVCVKTFLNFYVRNLNCSTFIRDILNFQPHESMAYTYFPECIVRDLAYFIDPDICLLQI